MVDSLCSYCQTNTREGGGGVAALACGHTFHEVCLEQHLRRSGIHDRSRLPCPHCRLDAGQCSEREAALMEERSAQDEPSVRQARKRPRETRPFQWPSSQRGSLHIRRQPPRLVSSAEMQPDTPNQRNPLRDDSSQSPDPAPNRPLVLAVTTLAHSDFTPSPPAYHRPAGASLYVDVRYSLATLC